MTRDCDFCRKPLVEGHSDPCIGNLPGVKFACCGHGSDRGYITFANGRSIYFAHVTHVSEESDTHARWLGPRD